MDWMLTNIHLSIACYLPVVPVYMYIMHAANQDLASLASWPHAQDMYMC